MEPLDPEIQALVTISTILDGLADAESRSRVLRWAADKFSVAHVSESKIAGAADSSPRVTSGIKFTEFVDLFDAVNPTSNLEKALTGAYWLQAVQGEASWQSLQVNNALKDTGNGLTHIVQALDAAQSKQPALVRQMAKAGKSQQSRKTYKLTTAGTSFIVSRLSSPKPTPTVAGE